MHGQNHIKFDQTCVECTITVKHFLAPDKHRYK